MEAIFLGCPEWRALSHHKSAGRSILYTALIQTLGALALLSIATAIALMVALILPRPSSALHRALGGRHRHPIAWAWGLALVATSGSLYLSEVVGFVPCSLCWYQRIAMYPLVLVLGAGMVTGESGVWRYALPLPVVGFVISLYHVIVQHRPTLDLVPCGSGPPCSGRYVAVFGYVTIPVMAGSAFLLIAMLLLTIRSVERNTSSQWSPE